MSELNGANAVWLKRACFGVGAVVLGILLVPVSIVCKDLLGGWLGGVTLSVEFLMVVLGSAATAVSVWKTSLRTPAARGVMAWGALGTVSPLFAYLFLVPWGLILLTAPLVIWFLKGHLRQP